jgi:hypothetical protein
MSRSKKKTPKVGFSTSETEKENKRKANRKFRRITKNRLTENDIQLPKKTKEISDVWSFDKGGKQFLKKPSKNDLRK